MTDDLYVKLEEMTARYQRRIAELEAEVESLSGNLVALVKVAAKKGHLKELPEDGVERWVI